jgi:hypothetical protein
MTSIKPGGKSKITVKWEVARPEARQKQLEAQKAHLIQYPANEE